MYDIDIDELTTCAFCMNYEEDVGQLIAGQFCLICDECIIICNKILFNNLFNNISMDYFSEIYLDNYYNFKYNKFDLNFENIVNNNYFDNYINNDNDFNEDNWIYNNFLDNLFNPQEIYQFLDKYITSQELSKKLLSISIYNHYKRLKFNLKYGFNLPKSNILIIGPSGSGKTFLIQTLSKILNIPFTIADATSLTEAGYVGEDVENILQNLFENSDFDIYKTEIGIIYIDEIDKIGKKLNNLGGGSRDISGEGVQQALLKFIEGTICSVCMSGNRRNPNQDFINISTENILFICGGAFYGLDKIIFERKKVNTKVGFKGKTGNIKNFNSNLLDTIESEDLIKFGLIPELIGRLPIITQLNDLNVDILIQILNNPNDSIIIQYNTLLSVEGINLKINKKAINIIAEIAHKNNTGARGLRNIIDNILINIMYEIPTIKTLKKIIIHEYIFNKDFINPLLIHYIN